MITNYFSKHFKIFKENKKAVMPFVFLGSIIIFQLIFLLFSEMSIKEEEKKYREGMNLRSSVINPLNTSFEDLIIPIEDLRLPGKMLHERKTFKRCIFKGPGALVIRGGNLLRNKFYAHGDIIAISDNVVISGIVFLNDSLIEDCKFYQITILTDKHTASVMKSNGFPVK